MHILLDHPFLLLVFSFGTLYLCAQMGVKFLGSHVYHVHEARQELTTVLTASLTLLGLIIGFSFSMAINRYDLRNQFEESEANAIHTEYLRADLLPAPLAARQRQLLKTYLALRIAFFNTYDPERLPAIDEQTAQAQAQLWAGLPAVAAAKPDPISALVVSGMNQVFDFQGSTRSAWENRIPLAAWVLMGLIAMLCNGLLGFSARHLKGRVVFLVLPLLVSVAFLLIADIDSPRGGGLIHVVPQNLQSLLKVLH